MPDTVVAKLAPAASGQRRGWPGRRKSFAALRSEATSEEFDSTGDRYGSVGGDSDLEDDVIRPMLDALPPWVLNGTRQIVDLCRRRGVVRYADIFGAGESAILGTSEQMVRLGRMGVRLLMLPITMPIFRFRQHYFA